MNILKCVCTELLSIDASENETGGILGGSNGIVTKFLPDKNKPVKESYMYIPNIHYLNAVLEKWQRDGVEFYGIFHTHPTGQTTLSEDDRMNIKTIMFSLPESVKKVYFPVIIPNENIYPYAAERVKNEINIHPEDCITMDCKEV